MPQRKSRAVGVLDKEGGRERENIGPHNVLDNIEDAGVADELIDPGQKTIGARAPALGHVVDRLAEPGFVAREPGAALFELGEAERRMRKREPVVVIGGDLRLAQHVVLPRLIRDQRRLSSARF